MQINGELRKDVICSTNQTTFPCLRNFLIVDTCELRVELDLVETRGRTLSNFDSHSNRAKFANRYLVNDNLAPDRIQLQIG